MNWNVPNILIIVRFIFALIVISLLLIIPFFPYSENPNLYVEYANIKVNILNYVALFFFMIAAYTDYLDGHLARKNNQITTFGKIFDPLADKILVNSVLIIFTLFGRIPIIFTIIFVIRDLLVDGLRIALASSGEVLAANKWGKFKTLFQFFGLIILFLIFPSPGDMYYNWDINSLSLIVLFIGLIFSVLSGIKYYQMNWNKLFK